MRMNLVGLGVVVSLGVWAAGCTVKAADNSGSDGGSGGPGDGGGTDPGDAGATEDVATVPTATIDAPQILNAGGPVMATPKIVPIYFGNDAFQAQLTTFLGKLPKSTYWKTIASEYGVGDVTVAPAVVATEKAPTTAQDHGDPTAVSAVKTFLQTHLDGAHPGWPAADENAIYTVFYPATTTVKLDTAASCVQFGGYHNETTVGAKKIVYAILPRCSGSPDGLGDFEELTVATSHELFEAVSDPYPFSAAAFNLPDNDHLVWQDFPLPELADMCSANVDANAQSAELGFTVQRMWSNKAAREGHNPCVPELAAKPAYFNAIPQFTDSVPFNFSDNNGVTKIVNTKGIKLAVGQSKTIPVKLFADGQAAPWTVGGVDLASRLDPSGQTPPELTFTVDKDTGAAGDTIQMTITRASSATSDIGGSSFLIVSKQGKSGPAFFWTGFVAE